MLRDFLVSISVLCALSDASFLVMKRDLVSGSRTNDVICEQLDYKGDSQFPPPVVITYPDGSTSCGCASAIVQGGNGSYMECNAIYPSFGQTGYNDPGLRQNACFLNSNLQAACATSCTPNTTPNSDGTCSPTNPDSYSLQSPTTAWSTSNDSPQETDGGNTPFASSNSDMSWTPSESVSSDDWSSETGVESALGATETYGQSTPTLTSEFFSLSSSTMSSTSLASSFTAEQVVQSSSLSSTATSISLKLSSVSLISLGISLSLHFAF